MTIFRVVGRREFAGVLGVLLFLVAGCSGPVLSRDRAIGQGERSVTSCPDAARCFEAARSHLESGNGGSARTLLVYIRTHWGESSWATRSGLLLAKLLAEEDPSAAFDVATDERIRRSVLGDHGLALAAQASRNLERPQMAAEYLERLAAEYPESPLAPAAWGAAADAREAAGQGQRALSALATLSKTFPNDSRTPSALQQIALLGERMGEFPAVARACRVAFTDFPLTYRSIELVCQRLPAEVMPPPTFLEWRSHARSLVRQVRFEEALRAWNEARQSAPGLTARREVDLEIGIVLYRLRRWDEASEAFGRLSRLGGASQVSEDAWLWYGRTAFRRDDTRELRRAEQALARTFPESARRLELLSLLAAMPRFERNTEAAIGAYEDLARVAATYGRTDKIVDARWNIAWLEYRHGRVMEALKALEQALAVAAPGDPMIPQLLYWAARLTEEQIPAVGQSSYAATLTSSFPYTYYGLLRQRGRVDSSRSELVFDVSERTPPLGGELPTRVSELLTLGWRQEAKDELLAAIQRQPPTSPEGAEARASALSELGASDEALRLIRRHFAPYLERGDTTIGATVWRQAYPDHLLTAIRERTGDRVDPFLIAGLIREESVYNPRAVSPVGAIGLMQLMPDTGQRVARLVGIENFSVSELFSPELNLTLGIRYLADLLDRFSGNEAYAVAAYNAGPEAVTRWIEGGPPRSIEEFIEEIPYYETRKYVKRVLRSAWLYRAMADFEDGRIVRAGSP